MITAGDNSTFAILAEITWTYESCLGGHLRFVFHDRPCGNWNDVADFRVCWGWLKDFTEKPRKRFEADLLDIPPSEVYKKLVDSVLTSDGREHQEEVYEHTYSRFHISHIGASAFDRVSMVLIENRDFQRCVWQDRGADDVIHDDTFQVGHMQKIARQFCDLLEAEAASLGFDLRRSPKESKSEPPSQNQ